MEEKEFDLKSYLSLFENAIGSNKVEIDKLLYNDQERKKRIYVKFKNELQKLAAIKHKKVDEEINELSERVDRLFHS